MKVPLDACGQPIAAELPSNLSGDDPARGSHQVERPLESPDNVGPPASGEPAGGAADEESAAEEGPQQEPTSEQSQPSTSVLKESDSEPAGADDPNA